MRGHELLEQHFVNRPSRLPVGPLLQPAQRRRAGQCLHSVGRRLQRQVVAQLPVVVEIRMAQCQCVDALTEQFTQAVLATGLTPGILQASGNRPGQTQPTVHGRQERNATVASDVATAEIGFDLAAFYGWKLHRSAVTFCHGG